MRRQTEGAALYRVQRRGRAVVRSVRSREWRASWNEKAAPESSGDLCRTAAFPGRQRESVKGFGDVKPRGCGPWINVALGCSASRNPSVVSCWRYLLVR